MVCRSDPGVPIGELAGIRLGVSDKFFQCRGWDRGMNCYGEASNYQTHYRVQILVRIIERTRFEQGLSRERCCASQEKSVAVRPRVCDLGSAQRTGRAPDIINKYRAQEGPDLVRPGTSQGVMGSARRKWNHEPNRPGWVRLRLRSARHC